MTCQHGFDEVNCPICRMSNHTKPEKVIQKAKSTNAHPLNQHEHFLKQFLEEKEQELDKKKDKPSNDKSLDLGSKQSFGPSPSLNKLPNFRNKMLLKRLNEIEPNSLSKFDLSKKVSLENPGWKFGEGSGEQLEGTTEREKDKDK
jgi:hypothetical protein